jgi:hypothetical protein
MFVSLGFAPISLLKKNATETASMELHAPSVNWIPRANEHFHRGGLNARSAVEFAANSNAVIDVLRMLTMPG